MRLIKYTFDRIEDGVAVFLQRPAEEAVRYIMAQDVPSDVTVGDIVIMHEQDGVYVITACDKETADAKAQVQSLIDKLRQKDN